MSARIFLTRALLVFLGGSLGTLARALITMPLNNTHEPWALAGVNIIGALALGFVVGVLGARGDQRALRQRAFVGVGLLGGFTSYSAFAVDALALGQMHAVWVSLIYVAATLICGVVASCIGCVAGATVARDRGEG